MTVAYMLFYLRNFVLSCIHVGLFNRDICEVFIIAACNVEQNYRVIIIRVQGRSILIVLECVALRPVGLILNIWQFLSALNYFCVFEIKFDLI